MPGPSAPRIRPVAARLGVNGSGSTLRGRSATGARNRHRIEDGKEVPPVNGLLVHKELNDSIQLSAMDGE